MMKFLLLIFFGMGCSKNSEPPSPPKHNLPSAEKITRAGPHIPARKFKIGDCILSTFSHEAWQPHIPRIVRAIGKSSYFVPSSDPEYRATFETLEFQWVEKDYKKVTCPKDDKQ